jgi:Protein of unknown function (DUF664)
VFGTVEIVNVRPWEPPIAGSESEHLLGALDRLRWTFRWKTDALTNEQLQARIGTSTLTLGGLLKHLAFVEDWHFATKLCGEPHSSMWEPDDDPFVSAFADDATTLYELWDTSVARSRARVAAALGNGGLDQAVTMRATDPQPSLRRMLCDLIEEYGRHTGHADLLRETIDGRVGEDPPDGWQPTKPKTDDAQP